MVYDEHSGSLPAAGMAPLLGFVVRKNGEQGYCHNLMEVVVACAYEVGPYPSFQGVDGGLLVKVGGAGNTRLMEAVHVSVGLKVDEGGLDEVEEVVSL